MTSMANRPPTANGQDSQLDHSPLSGNMPVDEQQHQQARCTLSQPEDDSIDSFERIFSYSRDMTKSLFANQTFAVPSKEHIFSAPNELDYYTKLIAQNDSQQQLAVVNKKPPQLIDDAKRAKLQAELAIVPHINAIARKKHTLQVMLQPEHHQPWKLYRVISGSGGWVHCIAVEPGNMWFASGSGDGLIKIWDLASGKLKLTLTGHISGVRGLAISERRPYMFSCAEDKTVKCWDLERNSVVRHYHGHLSGVYCVSLHHQDDVLLTGGRDSVVRVWDVRDKSQSACLTGHDKTVAAVLCQKTKSQLVISGSHDSTIRTWDLRKPSEAICTLTQHKKAVRSLSLDQSHQGFLSGAIDNIKQWELPEAKFVQNFSGHESIINALAVNQNNVAVSGGDDGTLYFWDWRTGFNFDKIRCPPQPGSIESEAGILALAFDRSGTRMITGESDKTIKMFREQ